MLHVMKLIFSILGGVLEYMVQNSGCILPTETLLKKAGGNLNNRALLAIHQTEVAKITSHMVDGLWKN